MENFAYREINEHNFRNTQPSGKQTLSALVVSCEEKPPVGVDVPHKGT